MKLLLINPNTTRAITDRMLVEARKTAAPDTELEAVTGRFGAHYVASRASYTIAGHAALDAYAEHSGAVDGVVLACFGDPALAALKEIAHQPVVGMAEASCLTAAALGGRFAIVTGGERWGPMLREFVASIGLAEKLAVVHTVAPTGGDIARDPDRAIGLLVDACNVCVEHHGADSVILGGAGLAGLSARIAPRVPVPVVDSLEACVRMAEQRVRERAAVSPATPSTRPDAVASEGLRPSLASLLGGK
jgi:allantoin racemase